jgi:hypothetical protein
MKKIIICVLLYCSPSYLIAIALPDTPDGYDWTSYEEAKSAFLKPDNWYVKKEKRGNTRALFLTKENIDKEDKFQTGLSVNVISNFSSSGNRPTSYAANYIMEIEKTRDIVLKPFLNKMADGIVGMGIRYRDVSKEPIILIHYCIIADDKADTLRLMFSESPEIYWDEEWRHGEKMLKGQLWR